MVKRLLASLPLFGVLWSIPTNAEVVVTIDVSDPSAVVLTATAAHAEDSFVDEANSFFGITLIQFFTTDIGVDPAEPEYIGFGDFGVLNSSVAATRRSLSLAYAALRYINFSDEFGLFEMNFRDSEPALTGAATLDLSGFGVLPEISAIGNVVVGSDLDLVVGHWEVVPEPSAAWQWFGVLIGLGGIHRMRWTHAAPASPAV